MTKTKGKPVAVNDEQNPAQLLANIKNNTSVLEQAMAAYAKMRGLIDAENSEEGAPAHSYPMFKWDTASPGGIVMTILSPLAKLPDDSRLVVLTAFANLHFDQMMATSERIQRDTSKLNKLLADSETASIQNKDVADDEDLPEAEEVKGDEE